MPYLSTPVDVCTIHARILTSSQDLDTMAKKLLTSLGFTGDSASWSAKVERVLADIAGSARLAVVQQICAAAHFLRARHSEEANKRFADTIANQSEFKAIIDLLTGLTSTDRETFDPECCAIIQSHLPELSKKSAAFTEDMVPLKTMQADLSLPCIVLATPRLELEAALNAWLRIDLPDNVVLSSKAAILQLSMLADERRAIVDRASTLTSDLSSCHSLTQEDQARVYDDLRGLARSLAIQVTRYRLHLTAIANAVHSLRNEFPALRVRGVDVAVRDLLEVKVKHSIYDG
uniref:Uncharacterized protein n=1 Tax=Ganoderma boninense TaxID=34458 RepID=A0A5K1JS66_9APHY|nr:Uncharacterized protein [Ganoderma boninense]